MPSVVDPLTLLIMAGGLAGFMLSSTTGLGAALVLVPVLTHVHGAQTAVALMAPVLAFNSGLKLAVFRRDLDVKAAKLALLSGMPGAAAGALLSQSVPDVWLRRIVGGIILAFVAQALVLGQRRFSVGRRGFLVLCGVTGVASGLSSAGGPTNAMALRSYGLERERFVATGALVSLGLQGVKLPIYVSTGALTASHVPLVLGLAAMAGVAALFGRRALRSMSTRAFDLGLYSVLCVLGVWMLR